MRRVTVEEMARDPVGTFVAGPTYAHFCASPDLWGLMLWGRPDHNHAGELGRSLPLELVPPAVPHAAIIDASRLEQGDPGAFQRAERYLVTYAEQLQKMVIRQALVRSRGVGGALIAGAFEVLPRPFPVAVFEDANAAFEWLRPGEPQPDGDFTSFLADLHAAATGVSPVVDALRVHLDAHLTSAELADAARALGMSERTLQRKLGAASTTFQDEVADARIRAAKKKLAEGDAPLTTIAFDVGCASLQHFSALFRKRTQESPSEYRARVRGLRGPST